ncbi:MAG TPA: ribosomal RNA small subunit methyltransferase A [Candidatus Poseidoniales archaeon]|jgi:16S rRNA (adenine1518-N6/adenine1519-N6)-dimethyltransferase|nr:MAG TPA: ribosomal RNA small subunit methyltransferase A [Candidatus Poseidoniales archaeon]HIH57805.1 ribosomal RNA small subunit methyltransferase A [Candidatus Poseidoniaceae archaeon]|tara:strand:- start:3209 stop:4042 length:834 start_codon:yes stop_codon:yes gene_type:complete
MGHGARVLIDRLRMRKDNVKALGQHFLNNEEILDETMRLAEISPDDHVIEIGPGPGVLTERLLESGCALTSIEIDTEVCEFLRDNFPTLDLIEGDALQVNWPKANKVVANIPYQISSPLIDIITRNHSIEYVVLLVQEEFAERLVVEWESDRGSLGMCTMLDWDCTFEMRVGPHCFTPSPQVHSRLVTMRRKDSPANSKLAKLLIRQGFAERRKKLRNTLSKAPKRIARVSGWHAKAYRDAMQSIDWDLLEERPEDLDIEDWLDLARLLEDARQAMG